jgi:hypothetical protein
MFASPQAMTWARSASRHPLPDRLDPAAHDHAPRSGAVANQRHPSLHSHPYESFPVDRNVKVWDSYVENNTPGAWRIFWRYGPEEPGGHARESLAETAPPGGRGKTELRRVNREIRRLRAELSTLEDRRSKLRSDAGES